MEKVKHINRFPAGIITPPPSKSIGHRAILCAALAAGIGKDHASAGVSTLYNIANSDDMKATLSAIKVFGATYQRNGTTLQIQPAEPAGTVVDCGESGSTLRFLIPIMALLSKEITLTGRGRLLQRPLNIYQTIFDETGVAFTQSDTEVRVKGLLQSGTYTLPGNVSSQFITGLLFALPLLPQSSEIRLTTELESAGYVDLTIATLRHFGITINQHGHSRYEIPGNQYYHAASFETEPDYSQAAFFLAAAALGRPVTCAGLNPNSQQGDAAILNILQSMGANVEQTKDGLRVTPNTELKAVTVDARAIPDLIPPIAALCCFCSGTSHIINAGRLRIKESDRLKALSTELGKLGADITEQPDGLTIMGKSFLQGGEVDAHSDHRIAMAMAVAAIRCRQPVLLSGWQNVNKSYPGFWEDFEKEAQDGEHMGA